MGWGTMSLHDRSRKVGGRRRESYVFGSPHDFDAIESVLGDFSADHFKKASRDSFGLGVTKGTKPTSDPQYGDDAARWLAEHSDAADGATVEDQVRDALSGADLDVEQASGAFVGRRGRPTKDVIAIRERVASALVPLYQAGTPVGMMAFALKVPADTLSYLVRTMANSVPVPVDEGPSLVRPCGARGHDWDLMSPAERAGSAG